MLPKLSDGITLFMPTSEPLLYKLAGLLDKLVHSGQNSSTNRPTCFHPICCQPVQDQFIQWINFSNLPHCPCGTNTFNVVRNLISSGTVDKSAISNFMEGSNRQLSDNRDTLGILSRLSKSSWNPLPPFYRQNTDAINTVSRPDPDPED